MLDTLTAVRTLVSSVFGFLMFLPAAEAQTHVFDPAKVTDVYRIELERDAMLLESIQDVIKQKDIRDGQVFITSGSVQECTYHYVATTDERAVNKFTTVKGPSEILSGGGLIADGEAYIHIALSNPERGAYGGHLEKGCRVLYLGEVTIYRFSGSPLTRRPNANGISILQAK